MLSLCIIYVIVFNFVIIGFLCATVCISESGSFHMLLVLSCWLCFPPPLLFCLFLAILFYFYLTLIFQIPVCFLLKKKKNKYEIGWVEKWTGPGRISMTGKHRLYCMKKNLRIFCCCCCCFVLFWFVF